MDYIWSDLHLNHENIILYEKRPFKSIKEMDDLILNNWKSKITKNDRLFNLGDFIFNRDKEYVKNLLRNLLGYKILIMGNHDRRKSVKWFLDVGFNEVSKYPIIIDDFYILSHEPVYISKFMPYANIHGHNHSELSTSLQRANVSVENTNYMPKLLSEVKKEILLYKGE